MIFGGGEDFVIFALPVYNPPMSRTSAQPPRTFAQCLRTIAWRITRTLLVAYLLVTLLACSFQERLVFPGAARSHGVPEFVVTPPPGAQLVSLTTSDPAPNQHTVALFGPALTRTGDPRPDAAYCPTIIYFYGNGMCLADTVHGEFMLFRQLGANVIIPELLGYGMATGSPSEPGCYAAAEAAYQHLLTRKDIDPKKIVAGGWSLGGAIACDLAAKHPDIAALFMFSSFTTMDDVAYAHYPFLPVSLILRHHFRSIDKLPTIRVPLLLIHGDSDSLIPYALSLKNQAAATHSPKVTHLAIQGADHNDFYLVGQNEILKALRQLLTEIRPPGEH